MREEPQPEPVCTYCKQPITEQQWPCKGMPNGEKAHLACYLDHMDDDQKNPEA